MSIESYNRNLRSPKFYNDTKSGKQGYNPRVDVYYGSDNNIVRITETWRGEIWEQIITGSNYAQDWPNYTYSETFYPWAPISSSSSSSESSSSSSSESSSSSSESSSSSSSSESSSSSSESSSSSSESSSSSSSSESSSSSSSSESSSSSSESSSSFDCVCAAEATGAGTAGANDEYATAGTYNAKTMYIGCYNNNRLWWDTAKWVISPGAGDAEALWYYYDDGGTDPWDGTYSVGTAGAANAPTVAEC